MNAPVAADVAFVTAAVGALTVALARTPAHPAAVALALVAVVALVALWRTRAAPRLAGHGATGDGPAVPWLRLAARVGVVLAAAGLLVALRPRPRPPAALVRTELLPSWPGVPDVSGPCPEGMVYVPAGTFLMGSAESDTLAFDSEKPQRRVTMSAFCIDRTEVTVAQYRACRGCSREQLTVDRYCTWSDAPGTREDYPINCVDWNQADAFCRAAGKELPTEAQWEYAARGSDGRIYPWGNDPPTATRANLCGEECAGQNGFPNFGHDAYAETAPVGSFPTGASPFGALDMIGNVWEWTADYGLNYRDLGTQPDPRGVNRNLRALRGGSWYGNDPRNARAAYRSEYDMLNRNDYRGFRCARGVTADSVNRH